MINTDGAVAELAIAPAPESLTDREMLVLELLKHYDLTYAARRLGIAVNEVAQIQVAAEAKLATLAGDDDAIDGDLIVTMPVRKELVLRGRAGLVDLGIDPDERVDAETDEQLRAGVPKNTVAAMAWGWGRFLRYCDAKGRRHEEPSVATVRDYIKDHWYMTRADGSLPGRHGRPYAPGTVKLAVYTLAMICNRLEWRNPVRNPLVNDQLKVYRDRYEKADFCTDESDPLTIGQVRAMARVCDLSTVYGLRNATMFLLQWDIGARPSELGALRIQDIKWVSEHKALVRFVAANTKTRTQRDVAVEAIVGGQHADVDPLLLLRRQYDAVRADGRSTGPLFPMVYSPGHGRADFATTGILAGRWREQSIDYPTYAMVFDRVVDELRLEYDERGNRVRHLTPHSPRIGLITDARDRGIPPEIVAARTGHSPTSPSFIRYWRIGIRWGDDNAGLRARLADEGVAA